MNGYDFTKLPLPWKVGEFVSSADPRRKVLMVATGWEQIEEYGAHKDFVRWVGEGTIRSNSRQRRTYLDTCLDVARTDRTWLENLLADPPKELRPIHLALIRIALRRTRGTP